jgi:DNA-binding GntR family transcriptional regulator
MNLPRHQQLAESLLGQIKDGTFAVGDRLPTEAELCETYGMARGTVRRTLGRLEQLGLIDRRAGRGTTVIATAPSPPYQPVASSPDDIGVLASETHLLKPEMGPIVVDATLARRLGTRSGTTWFVIKGPRALRRRDDQPLCWSEHYVRGETPPERFLHGTVDMSEIAHLAVEQTISAALLDEQMAAALGAAPDSAALVVTRRHRDAKGRLVSVGIHSHPADRYQITTQVN